MTFQSGEATAIPCLPNPVQLYFDRLESGIGFPGGSVVENLPANAGDAGSVPESGRSSREGTGNPLWYSCLENSMDRGAWQATVHAVAKESDTT